MNLGILNLMFLISMSVTAQTVDWGPIAERAAVKTDLRFCFEQVILKRAHPDSCNQTLALAQLKGITQQEAKLLIHEVIGYHEISLNAAEAADEFFKTKINELVNLDESDGF